VVRNMQSGCGHVDVPAPGHPASGQEGKLGPSGVIIVVSWWRSAYKKLLISLYPQPGTLPGPVTLIVLHSHPLTGRLANKSRFAQIIIPKE